MRWQRFWGIQNPKMLDVDWQSHGNLANGGGFLQISATDQCEFVR
jgi:hypothetical protein